MKVCVLLDFETMFKDTGIGNSVKRQRVALESAGIQCTDNPKDSYDILHINTFGPRSIKAALKCKTKGIPVVATANTTPEDWADSFWFSNMTLPVVKTFTKGIYQLADAVVCPSDFAAESLRKNKINSRLVVINHPIDLKEFAKTLHGGKDLRKKYGLKGTVVFGVGLVFPRRKGVDTFIEAARNFPYIDFVWFGKVMKGAMSPQGLHLIKSAPSNVKFTGYVDSIGAAFDAGDIFMFPSRSENFGFAILEAFAAKKPAIIRDIPGVAWAKKNVDCLKAATDEEFKRQLGRLLKDKKLRTRLARNAFRRAQKQDYKKVGRQYKKFYEELLRERR